jgi:PAS domain-containing protein
VVSALLSGLLSTWFLIEPIGSLRLDWPGGAIAIGFYAFVAATIVLLVDATHAAQARAGKARSSSERREAELQLLTDALPVLVSYMDRERGSDELRYRFVNRIYEEWFPKRREGILGRPVREVVGDEA